MTLDKMVESILFTQIDELLEERRKETERIERFVEENTKVCIECGNHFVDAGFDLICHKCIDKFYFENRKGASHDHRTSNNHA